MAAGKIFAVSFALNAVLGAGFGATMSRGAAVLQGLNAKTSALNAKQKELDRVWQNSQNAARNYAREMSRIQGAYNQGRMSQSQYRAEVARISARMSAAGMSAAEYQSRLQRLKHEMDQVRAAATRMRNAQAARNAAGANLSNAFSGVAGMATNAVMAATPFIGMVETAASFEQAMAKVQAITGITDKTDDRMKALTATARHLGETTQFSATQAAQAMSYLGMAGWNAEQIMSGIPGLLSLAAASGTDLARAADIVSDDLTAFGLSADQAGHMADVFAVTVTKTNTTVEMLGETMKYAAPVARAFGASMEETAAMAGLMANAGVKSSQAGTALRAGFLRLAGPPKKSRKAMEELGISLSEATAQQQEAQAALLDLGINMDDFSGTPAHKMVAVLNEIRAKTQNLTGEQKLATMQAIFGTEAATGWLNVIEAGPEAFDTLVEQMEHCDGEAEKMAKTMQDTFTGAMTKVKSALEGVAISVGSIFLPALKNEGEYIANVLGQISEWVKGNESLVTSFVEVAGGAIAAFGAFKMFKLGAAFVQYAAAEANYYGQVVRNTAVYQKMFTLATNAQGRAVTALRAAMNANIYTNFANSAMAAYGRVRAITWHSIGTRMWAGISRGVVGSIISMSKAVEAVSKFKGRLITNLMGIPERLAGVGKAITAMRRAFSFAGVMNSMISGFRLAAGAIRAFSAASMSFIFSPLGIALVAIAGAALLIYQNWETVGPFFMGLWAQITTAFTNAWTMIQPAIAQFWQACVQLGIALIPVFQSLWVTIQAAWAQITAVFAENQGAIDMVIGVFVVLAEVVGVLLVGAFVGFANIAVGVVTAAIGTIASIITGLLGIFSGFISAFTALVNGDLSGALDGVVQVFRSAFNMVKGIVNSVLGGISSAINGIISTISNIRIGGGGGGQKIAANAQGGIYRKGAFLTTFAEEGPEAAIPLDGSPRAIGLWQKAGEILGVGQKQSKVIRQRVAMDESPAPSAGGFTMPPISITVNVYGDNNPGEVKQAVMDAGRKCQKSFAEQMAAFEHERGRLSFG